MKLFILLFLFFILITGLIGVGMMAKIIRMIFGGRQRTNNSQSHQYRQSHYQSSSRPSYTSTSRKEKKKVFDDDEGEYVDFEENNDKP